MQSRECLSSLGVGSRLLPDAKTRAYVFIIKEVGSFVVEKRK